MFNSVRYPSLTVCFPSRTTVLFWGCCLSVPIGMASQSFECIPISPSRFSIMWQLPWVPSLENLHAQHALLLRCRNFVKRWMLVNDIRWRKCKNGQNHREWTTTHKFPQRLSNPHWKLIRQVKKPNLRTYKYHALGDYADMIRQYETTDSYSTEPVSGT